MGKKLKDVGDVKPKKGRPAYKPTEIHHAVVRALAIGGGRSQDYIAHYIGITKKTLVKHYKTLLEEVKGERNDEVENALYVNAVARMNIKAQMFYLEKNMPEKYGKFSEIGNADEDKAQILKQLILGKPD